jgi:hypothetical protein
VKRLVLAVGLVAALLVRPLVVRLLADTPPTVTGSSNSTLTGAATSEVTGSVSWNSGDLVVVTGLTDDNASTLGVPTTSGSGLSFTQKVTTAGTNGADCKAYVWSAIASATSSGTITSTASGSIHAMLNALVYSGSAGLGASNSGVNLAGGTAPSVSLTRANNNSAVVVGICDFNGGTDATVTNAPASGGTQRIATADNPFLLGFVIDWTDQGASGTTSYGFTAGQSGADWSGVVVEVKGTAAAGATCVPTLGLLGVSQGTCGEAQP